jgi:phosphoesterase RecJ-like protein
MVKQGIKRFFNIHNRFLILGHSEPDGDCVSSQLSLAHFLNRTGKSAVCCSAGPFDRPEISEFEARFKQSIPAHMVKGNTAAVIVDCSTGERVGPLYEKIGHLPLLIIDHHQGGPESDALAFIDSRAPSTTWLIHRIITALGGTPDAEEARFLLFGLCTDTGFFRHLDETSYDVFPLVSRLTRTGVPLKQVYHMMYGGRSLMQRKLLARLLERAESFMNDKIIITCRFLSDTDPASSALRGSEELYSLLQTVERNELIAYIRQETPTHCSVGLRSTKICDVSRLARRFGGGGHKLAAGFSLDGSVDEIKKLVLRELTLLLREISPHP